MKSHNYCFSVVTSGQWNIFEMLSCSWGRTYTSIDTLDSSFEYPWAFNDCDYQPITVTGTVTNNSVAIPNVQVTFTYVTGYKTPVTVS